MECKRCGHSVSVHQPSWGACRAAPCLCGEFVLSYEEPLYSYASYDDDLDSNDEDR